jgi:hypothetical protein
MLLALSAAAVTLIAVSAAWTVHSAPKYMKEDWRGLAAFLQTREASAEGSSLSEPEIALPLSYYFQQDLIEDGPALIPTCGDLCWWVLRQPYTATHAFTNRYTRTRSQSAAGSSRGCQKIEYWESPTGVSAWELACQAIP